MADKTNPEMPPEEETSLSSEELEDLFRPEEEEAPPAPAETPPAPAGAGPVWTRGEDGQLVAE